MIRVVLGVLLTTALLGVALPAVDTASADHSARLTADRVERFAAGLRRFRRLNDAGARWTVTLAVPGRSWASAPTTLRLAERDGRARATWHVGGGPAHRTPLPAFVRLPEPVAAHGSDLSLRVRLERGPDGPVTVVRGFK